MIKIIKGNIFNSECQTIVNPVNCDGVMGKGLALLFKEKYPDMYEKYRNFCKRGLLNIGLLMHYEVEDNKFVLNFPTKQTWQHSSKLEYIELGLKKFVSAYKEKGITSCAFPMLGCGLGKLKMEDVLPLMVKNLMLCDIDIEIYI